ncbi:MAG: hypothetical protein Fur0024_3380 [Patescibacteria group bacterium]
MNRKREEIEKLNESAVVVLGFPNTGNEPYLTIAHIAKKIKRKKEGKDLVFLIPKLYGEKQRNILLEEIQDESVKACIYLIDDDNLNLIFKNLTFNFEQGFREHLQGWVDQFEETRQKLNTRLLSAKPIRASNLSGKTVEINSQQIQFGLNIGSKVPTPESLEHKTIYYFSYALKILFEQIKTLLEEDKDKLKQNQQSGQLDQYKGIDLNKIIEIIEKLERTYYGIFIIWIGTFAYLGINDAKYHLAPLMKDPVVCDKKKKIKKKKSVYVVLSGTGSGSNLIIEFAKKLYQEGWTIYCPSFSTKAIEEQGIQCQEITPDDADKYVNFVLHRGGYETISRHFFQNLVNLCPEPDQNDDLEIIFNLKTMEQFGFGIVFKKSDLLNPKLLSDNILKQRQKIQRTIEKLNKQAEKRFGTRSGIEYIASQLIEMIMHYQNKNQERLLTTISV